MTMLPRLSAQLLSTAVRRSTANANALPSSLSRLFHSSPVKAAIAHPITAHGPPPKAPAPSPEFGEQQQREEQQTQQTQQQEQQQQQQKEQQRVEEQQQRKQEEEEDVKLSEAEKGAPAKLSKPTPLKKRFWRNVDVRERPGMLYFTSPL